MSTKSSPKAAGTGSPVCPPSPVSPRTLREGSAASYFINTPSSPRLHTITEHMATPNYGKRKTASVSGISFLPPTDASCSRVSRGGDQKQREKGRRRTTSPPAPSKFESHVSFDNFAGGEPTEHNPIAFTLNEKHMGYQYKRRSRTFMVGIDENAYSDYALQWMLDEMVDDGDEIVCLRVVDKDSKISNDKSMTEKQYQKEAKRLMKDIQAKNAEHRAISIVLEFAVGKLHTTFQKMIQLYEPAMLIVGTRGRSLGGVQGLINNRNSFSKWCLQYSPIPVVVVRPTEKRDKKKIKRANDPTRHNYALILQGSGVGTHEANATPQNADMPTEVLPVNAPEEEAHEVAAALGLPSKFDPTIKLTDINERLHTSKAQHGQHDTTAASLESSPDSRPTSPEAKVRITKSKSMDSPAVSDEEDTDNDDDDDDDDEDDDGDDDDDDGDFEVTPGHTLVGKEPQALEKQQKLHAMEKGEAAALAAGRKGSIGSIDSSISNSGNDQG